jgi:hypothetical protein
MVLSDSDRVLALPIVDYRLPISSCVSSNWKSAMDCPVAAPVLTSCLSHHPTFCKWLALLLFFASQLLKHGKVFQRRNVTGDRTTGGDLAQQAAHDFSGTRLRQRIGKA